MSRILLAFAVSASICAAQTDPFVRHANLPAGDGTGSLTISDFNGDGKKDIAVMNTNARTITVLMGDGRGGFTPAPGGPVHTDAASNDVMTSGDFNGDGHVDLAYTEQYILSDAFALRAIVRFGVGDGTFAPSPIVSSPLGGAFLNRLAAVDINGDGKLDLVGDGIISTLQIFSGVGYLGDGTGAFRVGQGSTAFGDFNRDGRLDYITTSSGGENVYLNNGIGGYDQLFVFSERFQRIEVTDYDGDGVLDFLGADSSGTTRVVGYRGDGAGMFFLDYSSVLTSTQSTSTKYLSVGDFDGDGVPDWAASGISGTVTVGLVQLPAFASSPLRLNYDVGPNIFDLKAADLDGDGRADLVGSNGWDLLVFLTGPQSQQISQTITFDTIPDRTVNAPAFSPVVSASSGLPVTLTTNAPNICTVTANVVTILAGGMCILRADQGGDGTTRPAHPAYRTFLATKLLQKIVTPSISTLPLGTSPFLLQAKASSGLPVQATAGGVCTVNGLTLTFLTVGRCTVSVFQNGNEVYSSAQISMAIQVTSDERQTQSIFFPLLTDQVLSPQLIFPSPQLIPLPQVTSTSMLSVPLTSNTPAICTVSSSGIGPISPGTCSITASQAGSAEFFPATPVTRTFSITPAVKRPQTITANGLTSWSLASLQLTGLDIRASSLLPVTIVSNSPTVCQVQGSIPAVLTVGVCSLTATQAGNDFYLPAPAANFTVNILNVPTQSRTVFFELIPDLPLGTAPLRVKASNSPSSSTGPPLASNTPGICTVASSTVTLLALGTCSIVASFPGDSIYLPAPPVTRTFQVVPPNAAYPQRITIGNTFPYATPGALAMNATASSGLLVVFTSQTPSVCTTPGPTIILANALGTCVITLTQPGNSVFAPAIPQTISFPVLAPLPPPGQTISIAPIGNKTLGDPSFPVVATANSGLPVTYTTTTSGVCSLSENWVTLVGVGTCMISASRSGDVFFNTANASISFAVSDTARIAPAIQSIKNGASYAAGVLAPSSYGSIFGTNFLVSPVVTLHDANGADFTLVQNYTGDTQINALLPENVALGSATLAVTNSAGTSQLPLTIAAVAPGIISADATGSGPVAGEVQIVNEDGSVTKYGVGLRAIPIAPNAEAYLILYASGIRGHSPNGVSARVGGLPVEVQYAGSQEQYPGLDQVNLKLPPQVGSLGQAVVQLTVDGIDANPVVVYFEGTDPVRYTRSR